MDEKERELKGYLRQKTIKIAKAIFPWLALVVSAAMLCTSLYYGFIYEPPKPEEEKKVTTMGFADVGKLVTQECRGTGVSMTKEARKLFGVKIPFTQSKYIYSYDVTVQAYLDFTKVEAIVDEINGTITVKMPDIELEEAHLHLDSFKVYHEAESIFKRITLEDFNADQTKLTNYVQTEAVRNGLIERAEENAKKLLEQFIGQMYNLDEFEPIVFETIGG